MKTKDKLEPLSEEIRLGREGAATPVELAEWSQINDAWLMHNMPTQTVFQIEIDDGELDEASSEIALSAFSARLVRILKRHPRPSPIELKRLGRESIIGFLFAKGILPGEQAADREYDRIFGLLTDLLVREFPKHATTRALVVPPLADFLTMLAIKFGGEPGVRAIMSRIEGRIGDWKKGLFPTDNLSANRRLTAGKPSRAPKGRKQKTPAFPKKPGSFLS